MTDDVASGSADVSATGRVPVPALPPTVADCGSVLAEGLSVGNSPEAFPPGLRLDPLPFSDGRVPAGSVEVTPDTSGGTDVFTGGAAEDGVAVGVGVDPPEADFDLAGAVTDTATDAFGAELMSLPVPVAVSVTDLTEVAEVATATCAASWRVSAPASTVPRSHMA